MNMLYPHEIAALRNRLGESLKKFGERFGVSESTVHTWETGKRHPQWGNMTELNKLLAEMPPPVNGKKNGKK